MAFFFGESFDLYTTGANMLGHWDNTSLNPDSSGFVTGRFATSRGINLSSSSRYIKASGANDSVHHFSMGLAVSSVTGSSLGAYFELDDGTTAQCTAVFRSDGNFYLTSGGPGGAVLATWPAAFSLASPVWYSFEIEVVVHNTNGSVAVRRNGSPVNDFFQGGLDTSLTGNNYANRLVFATQSAATFYIDDLLWRSDAASVPWLGDVRCYTRYPIADVSAQFTRAATSSSIVLNGAFLGQAFGANTASYARFTATYNGLVSSASVNCSVSGGGGTGHVKMALFSVLANGGIGTLLATSAEITNPTAATITFTFPTPGRVVQGQQYWMGICHDASITFNVANTGNTVQMSSPYATWPISSPGGTVGGNNIPGTFTIYTSPGINADSVSEPRQDAAASYVYSSTPGQADFYTLSALNAIPATVFGVVTRGYFTKSDSGTRSATIQLKSGATTVQGAPATFSVGVWTWVERTDQVDPATGVAWTVAGVDNVTIGPLMTA
ncbi:MAG TPA: hypothetical protein VF077_05430 [Nitrospiraceae bacterium]